MIVNALIMLITKLVTMALCSLYSLLQLLGYTSSGTLSLVTENAILTGTCRIVTELLLLNVMINKYAIHEQITGE